MYYPLQIPNILDKDFFKHVDYQEEIIPELQDFVICFWQMQPKIGEEKVVRDLVLIDGCTELVISYINKTISYAAPSMSKTAYDETTPAERSYIGAKLKPGAFTQLTGLPATAVDGNYLKLEDIDEYFDSESLIGLTFEETKTFLKNYMQKLIQNKKPNEFVKLFDELCNHPPTSAEQLYQKYHFSPRQCQRHFIKNFGITPQMVLTILRFHFCLNKITAGEVAPNEILDLIQFSDQSHFIREFKKYLGLTPYEYLKKYQELKMIGKSPKASAIAHLS